MSDWNRIKLTPEFREARAEVEKTIEKAIRPLRSTIGDLEDKVRNLQRKIDQLESQLRRL